MGDRRGATQDVGCEGRQGQQPGRGVGGETRLALLPKKTLLRADDELGGERPVREDPGDPQGVTSRSLVTESGSQEHGGRWRTVSPGLLPSQGSGLHGSVHPALPRPTCPHLFWAKMQPRAHLSPQMLPSWETSSPQPHPLSWFSCRPPRKIFFFLNYYEFLFFSQEQDPIETRLWKKCIGGLLHLSLTLPKHGFSQASLIVARSVPRGTDLQPSSQAWYALGWRPLRGCESLRASLPAASQLPMKSPPPDLHFPIGFLSPG